MRPIRPPRRFAIKDVRLGNSFMISRRTSVGKEDHDEISSMVRLQPMQMRACGWITHSLTQGESTSLRLQTSSLTRQPH